MSNILGSSTAKAEGSFGILYFHCELRNVWNRGEAFLILCIWRFLYNTHRWRHVDIFWNIPDLIHLLLLFINFLEQLKWQKCRVDRGFEWETFRTQNMCSGAFSFASQCGSTCLLEELSATNSVAAAVVFVCLYICTRGCFCEGLAGLVLLRTSSSKGAGPFQHYMLCWSFPFPRGCRNREDKKRNLTLQSVASYSLFCHFPGCAKAHRVVQDATAWRSGSALPSDSWAVLFLQSWEITDGILSLHDSKIFLWTKSVPKVLIVCVLIKGWCHLQSGLLCPVLLSGQVFLNVNGCLFLIFWSSWAV